MARPWPYGLGWRVLDDTRLIIMGEALLRSGIEDIRAMAGLAAALLVVVDVLVTVCYPGKE